MHNLDVLLLAVELAETPILVKQSAILKLRTYFDGRKHGRHDCGSEQDAEGTGSGR